MEQKNIFAFTPADASSRPPYVSLNDRGGYLVLTLRGYSGGGTYAESTNVDISIEQAKAMADGINNYLAQTAAPGVKVAGWVLPNRGLTTADSFEQGENNPWISSAGAFPVYAAPQPVDGAAGVKPVGEVVYSAVPGGGWWPHAKWSGAAPVEGSLLYTAAPAPAAPVDLSRLDIAYRHHIVNGVREAVWLDDVRALLAAAKK